jgi:hypothetical protein
MKFCENIEVDMLKIIIIIIGYTLNNFITHHNTIVDDENKLFKFFLNEFIFCKKIIIGFVIVEIDPR